MKKSQIVRCFSTRSVVDKWFNALQSRTHDEQQAKLSQCIEYSLQQDQFNYSNLIRDIVHRWAIEHPKTEALWIDETDIHHCQKLTFHDVYTQGSHLANVLTGNQFNLTTGKSVLVILPHATKERLLIQFACLQNGLICHSYDPKYLFEQDIRQQIRTLAIDCIITNTNHLELIMSCTYNSLRPLKKGLITDHITSEPLPVGWHHLIHSINTIERKDSTQPIKRFLRHLISDKPVNQYSQATLPLRSLFIAYWLNMHTTPRLIWLKEDNTKIFFAPWLLGSTIFHKETKNIETMFQTFGTYPIDTFCASENNYQMLNKQPQNTTHLQQLLSTGPITDPTVKSRWYSATNLHIRDNSVALNDQSALKYKQLEIDKQRLHV